MGMEIGYIYYHHTRFEKTSGAASLQTISTCQSLSDLGHNITLFCSGDAHKYARNNGLSIDFMAEKIPVSIPNYYIEKLFYYLYATTKSRNMDAIFTRDISFLRFLYFLPIEIDTPIIYEAHKAYWGTGDISRRCEKKCVSRAEKVITHSQGVVDDLDDIGVSVDKIVSSAGNLNQVPEKSKREMRDELGIDLNNTIYIYSGGMIRDDIEFLIDGFCSLQADYSDIQLYLLGGDESHHSKIIDYLGEKSINEESVILVGRVSQDKVFEYLKAADIGVIPLVPSEEKMHKYTSPLKLYEYLISGLQVVGSNVYSLKCINQPSNLHLYVEGELDSFITACEQAMSQKKYKSHSRKIFLQEASRTY